MTIGRLADAAGVNVETIRFYERSDLLERPRRPPSGYRTYDPGVVERIRFIRHAQELGFSLAEIRELLSLRVDPSSSCGQVKARAVAKIADVEEKIDTLRRMRAALITISDACSGEGPTTDCPILDAFGRADGGRADRSNDSERSNVMARFKEGERYRCPEPACGCEIEVKRGAPETCAGDFPPRCCCGRDMVPAD